MSGGSGEVHEADFEMAERATYAEVEAQTLRAQRSLSAKGCATCCDCGFEIDPARRAAAPFAARCMPCQQAFERGAR